MAIVVRVASVITVRISGCFDWLVYVYATGTGDGRGWRGRVPDHGQGLVAGSLVKHQSAVSDLDSFFASSALSYRHQPHTVVPCQQHSRSFFQHRITTTYELPPSAALTSIDAGDRQYICLQ